MKKLYLLILFVPLLMANGPLSSGPISGGSAASSDDNIIISADCSTVIGLGQMCQDSVTKKLYIGDGSSAIEILTVPGMYLSTPTDGHIVGYDAASGKLKDIAAPTTGFNDVTIGQPVIKTGASTIGNPTNVIDAHAASTTITLYPGTCVVIHNSGQGAADINNAMPALAEGLCFMGQIRTAQGANYWRLTAASVNTINLNKATTGKDYIQFDTPAIGDAYVCFAVGTSYWDCRTANGSAAPTAGDL